MTEDEFNVRLSGVHDEAGGLLLLDEIEKMRSVAFEFKDYNRLPRYATMQAQVAERLGVLASGTVGAPVESEEVPSGDSA